MDGKEGEAKGSLPEPHTPKAAPFLNSNQIIHREDSHIRLFKIVNSFGELSGSPRSVPLAIRLPKADLEPGSCHLAPGGASATRNRLAHDEQAGRLCSNAILGCPAAPGPQAEPGEMPPGAGASAPSTLLSTPPSLTSIPASSSDMAPGITQH